MSTDPAVTAAAESIGAEPRAFAAVTLVESAGTGLNPDGTPVIRVEAHVFWRALPAALRARADLHFRVYGPGPWEGHAFDGDPRPDWPATYHRAFGYHGSQRREWDAYRCAAGIHPDAAMRATSWGAGQVLGAWDTLGFPSGPAFVAAQSSRAGQLDTMARFVRTRGLVAALNAHDWRAFAARYNGTGNVDLYSGRLAAAYARSR